MRSAITPKGTDAGVEVGVAELVVALALLLVLVVELDVTWCLELVDGVDGVHVVEGISDDVVVDKDTVMPSIHEP